MPGIQCLPLLAGHLVSPKHYVAIQQLGPDVQVDRVEYVTGDLVTQSKRDGLDRPVSMSPKPGNEGLRQGLGRAKERHAEPLGNHAGDGLRFALVTVTALSVVRAGNEPIIG
jgi:hypothetical protein